jgi:glycosyltransferase involved in cell wall biosynthesis
MNQQNNQQTNVAVIIPVYKAHETIVNTLHSIAMQRHIDFSVYLIVDGEPTGEYDYLTVQFPYINIYYLSENKGPGVARQYGIDHSDEPFISFIDADDTYLTALSLYYMQRNMTEKIAVVSCNFMEEKNDHNLHLRENDMVWMHSKLYRRAFLDKHDIRFNETRANEDVGFNTQCQCYANADEQIYMSKDLGYLWQWRDGSTVRSDNQSYAYNESIDGYVINKIYAFERVLASQPIDDGIKFFIMMGLMYMFRKYLMAMMKAPKQVKHVRDWAARYYRELYKLVDAEYITKAERSIFGLSGFKTEEQYIEYAKWLKRLARQPRTDRAS